MPRELVLTLLIVMLMLLAVFTGWEVSGQIRTVKAAQAEVVTEPPDTRAIFRETSEVKSPLAILVLDRSGSMSGNDPQKLQPVAATLFAHVFARVIRDDTTAATKGNIHLAVIPFDHVATPIRWSGLWGIGGSPFLALYRDGDKTVNNPDHALDKVDSQLPGSLSPRGGTEIQAACEKAVELAREYRQLHGADAEVFFIVMSDFNNAFSLVDAQVAPLRSFEQAGHATHRVVHIQGGQSDMENMIPGFLSALGLHPVPVDLATGVAVAGYSRALPLVIKFSTPPATTPSLVADDGQVIPLRGNDRHYYAVFDPIRPDYASIRTLRLADSSIKVESATLYVRAEWALKVEPRVVRRSMMKSSDAPLVTLRYTGAKQPANPSARLEIESPNSGEAIEPLKLGYESTQRTFSGRLPAFPSYHSLNPTQPYRVVFHPLTGGSAAAIYEKFFVEAEFDLLLRRTDRQEVVGRVDGLNLCPR